MEKEIMVDDMEACKKKLEAAINRPQPLPSPQDAKQAAEAIEHSAVRALAIAPDWATSRRACCGVCRPKGAPSCKSRCSRMPWRGLLRKPHLWRLAIQQQAEEQHEEARWSYLTCCRSWEPGRGWLTTFSQALWHLQGYFIFREEVKAYITNFCSGISSRTVAKYMRSSCLLASSRMYVAHTDSPEEIFETQAGIFCQPNKLIDSILEPIKKMKRYWGWVGVKW
jgi:hypothetical protein